MRMSTSVRSAVFGLCLAVGAVGAAKADFNIWSASKAADQKAGLEQVKWNSGAAFAVGTMGVIAGAAIASSANRRYCDPYYEYCGPRPVYRERYYEPGYRPARRAYRPDRPGHYPVDLD